jgi:GNAT superfamily N-acetyltransferase
MQAGAKAEVVIWKAAATDLDAAFHIIEEYYEAANVVARDTKEEFAKHYFGKRSGVWLASFGEKVAGCIALRELAEPPRSGEIKRMYVQPTQRERGIAKLLLGALESFASTMGYEWLYLDSAPGMDTAINFYRRHGYKPCERYNDNPQANIYLRKKIR